MIDAADLILEVEVEGVGGPVVLVVMDEVLVCCLIGLDAVTLLVGFVGLALPPSVELIDEFVPFLNAVCSPSVVGATASGLLIDAKLGFVGELGRLEARERGRDEEDRGLLGVVTGVDGRD